MGIVSYAQNLEDVILWRALKDVENGFYIDVGANHPVIDSVTKAFYEHGWNGINIEPEFELFEFINQYRPRDLNLNVAISSKVESIEFYVSSVRGWSTTDKNSYSNLKDKDSFSEVRTIQALSLDKLCEEYSIEIVHFLKVDVEGAEKDVLESFSFDKVRPWICVVEATKPTTQIDVSDEWEYLLLDNEYIFAYFDGLNKYYVSKEKEELLKYFKYPPNVFDGYIVSGHRNALLDANEAEEKASQAEEKASQAEEKASQAEEKASRAQARTNDALHHYHSVINSNSWKLTKPLRVTRKFVRWFYIGVYHWITFSPTSRPRRTVKKVLISLKNYINARPALKYKIMTLLNRFPKLKARLKRVWQHSNIHIPGKYVGVEYEHLSPEVKEIYYKLKKAIDENKKSMK